MYDKRGVGDSSGTNPQSLIDPAYDKRGIQGDAGPVAQLNIAACGDMFNVLAGDALAGIESLRARTDIDPARTGFFGISQAGWIMPLAASRRSHVAFIISVSGPAVTCGIENRYSELTGDNLGFSDLRLSAEDIDRRLREYDGPDGYDPVPVLRNLRVPILWVLGGQDRSVPTNWSVASIKMLVAQGAPFDLLVYPDGDHGLRRGGSNWRHIDYWSDVRAWLVAHDFLHNNES
jgi:dienelactone hydrolase